MKVEARLSKSGDKITVKTFFFAPIQIENTKNSSVLLLKMEQNKNIFAVTCFPAYPAFRNSGQFSIHCNCSTQESTHISGGVKIFGHNYFGWLIVVPVRCHSHIKFVKAVYKSN